VFKSENNHHFTRQFCKVVLDPTTIFKIISEPSQKSVGPHAIRFSLSNHPQFISTLQM
jgi:hypothetical protein